MLTITVLQSASYASTASALPSTASNTNVHHTASGGTQSDNNNPPNSGSEEHSLTPPRSPSTSTARSAVSSGYSTSYAPSSTLISPNLSHGRLSKSGYPEASVSQLSPVRRPSHGFNTSISTPPPPRYFASQVRSSSSLGQVHVQQQQQEQPMTGSNNSGELNHGRQQQQRVSSSSTSSSLDFASFVQTSPIGMSSTRQTYHPHGPTQQRPPDQQQRVESLISVASPNPSSSSAPTSTSFATLTNTHRTLTSDDPSV